MVVAGIDEAGRGPLAGPVVAAAVILSPNYVIDGLNDSKKLNEKTRDYLFDQITQNAISYGIGSASVAEIDEINILQATLLAMRRAVLQLTCTPDEVWVDGNQDPKCGFATRLFVGGDASKLAISAASILAKVTRDRLMKKLDKEFPMYGFAKHKGYGTTAHLLTLQQFGASPHHRRSFAPVRNVLAVI